jgi:PTH1 family peptidyl-tRNA hydrolase
LLDKENIPLENLLVVTDDVDLDLGALRMRSKGSGGSHNGLNHIIETLQTTDWARLRTGTGKIMPGDSRGIMFLGRWSSSEKKSSSPVLKLL